MAFNPKQKILIIDDMSTMRKIIKNMLGKMGCNDLHEADDGAPAWEMIQQAHEAGKPFEFIVSDWNMPGLTGLDLLKNLRADERFKKLPFLMITAEAEQANVIIAVKAGVSNFIVKPFSIVTLKEKIDKIFPG
ncbi:MAG: response regulator [Bacteriovoracaceae bacterium]|jgi:two-component system chemotaxis response regulator CheY|nr:response regulator [Halobacteriovoraceae bacterium]MDP7320006.1 response regulator [Bacteriovoracaceae bacterium]